MVVSRSQPILQDKGGDTHGIKPIGYLTSFQVLCESLIGATRGNDHCRADRFAKCRIKSERGLIPVFVTKSAGSAVFPKRNGACRKSRILRQCFNAGYENENSDFHSLHSVWSPTILVPRVSPSLRCV